MKNSIKTAALLAITLVFVVVFSSHYFAQKEEAVYGFGYAYNVRTNTFYVSNIVSACEKPDVYIEPTATSLYKQWRNRIKAEVNNYTEYQVSTVPTSFLDSTYGSYPRIFKDRNRIIGEYRQKGYTIYKILDFHYQQDK